MEYYELVTRQSKFKYFFQLLTPLPHFSVKFLFYFTNVLSFFSNSQISKGRHSSLSQPIYVMKVDRNAKTDALIKYTRIFPWILNFPQNRHWFLWLTGIPHTNERIMDRSNTRRLFNILHIVFCLGHNKLCTRKIYLSNCNRLWIFLMLCGHVYMWGWIRVNRIYGEATNKEQPQSFAILPGGMKLAQLAHNEWWELNTNLQWWLFLGEKLRGGLNWLMTGTMRVFAYCSLHTS